MADKKVLSEAGRWLRVGTLTISTLGPIISTLLTRIREQQLRESIAPAKTEAVFVTNPVQPVALMEPAEKPSLSESLLLLKERAYNQELLHRAEEIVDELRQRSARLSQSLAERGSDLTSELSRRGIDLSQFLAERGSDFTNELGKRGSDLTNELSKRGSDFTNELGKRGSDLTNELGKKSKKASKNWQKQTRKVSRNLSEQDSTVWIISGFSIGLVAASVVAFILIRNRLKQQQDQEGDEHILLSRNGHMGLQNSSTLQSRSDLSPSSLPSSATPNTAITKPVAASVSATPVQTPSKESAPLDAAFLGISSTKRYYPAQTPLDQLSIQTEQPLDVVYFSSEADAQAQGYTPAEE